MSEMLRSEGASPPGDLAEDASRHAAQLAASAGVVVEELHDHRTAREAATLLDGVWGRATGSVMSPEALTALTHAGGQVSLARRGDEVVAVTAAFLGRDEQGATFLHSHVTGVDPSSTGQGIGRAMKWHQRAWCLARDIGEVRWTFDPLVRRNAVLNLLLLGAQAVRYDLDVYGAMDDARNAGLPTDRLLASWRLDAPRVRAAASGREAAPDLDGLRQAGAKVLLAVDDEGAPQVEDVEAPRRLVQVPEDIESIRARDLDQARAWAGAVRATLGSALREGARVSGMTRDGWYVLVRSEGVTELAGR